MGRDDNIAALPSSVEEMLSLSESVVVGTIKERITEPARGFARECEAQARGPALAGNDLITAGLINSHKFSRDCLIKAIEGLDTELNVVPFGSIKDCIGSDLKRIDLVIYHHHSVRELEGTTANGMTAIREALPDIPLLVLSDAEDAEQLDALRSALSSGVHGFIPTRTTGISVTVAAIRFSRLLPSTDACAGSKVRTIIDEP